VSIATRDEPLAASSIDGTIRDSYPAIRPGYHLNKRHWNTITLDGTLSDQLVRDLIEDSYDLVVSALSGEHRKEVPWVSSTASSAGSSTGSTPAIWTPSAPRSIRRVSSSRPDSAAAARDAAVGWMLR
jgi:hypothetical protein